jgi:uncharacterized protein (TIGR03000 family)
VTVVTGGCHGCNGCACNGAVACHGCSGCTGSTGHTPAGPQNDAERKAVEDTLKKLREKKKKDKAGGEEETVSVAPNRARVVVTLPADARLWVDQVACPIEGAVRSFDTPELAAGQRYAYTLRVEVERNGQRLQDSRRIPLVAGERVEVDFTGVGTVRTAQGE